MAKLRTRWTHADTITDVRREDGQRLYKMLFASDHPAGAEIGRWARGEMRATNARQTDLFD